VIKTRSNAQENRESNIYTIVSSYEFVQNNNILKVKSFRTSSGWEILSLGIHFIGNDGLVKITPNLRPRLEEPTIMTQWFLCSGATLRRGFWRDGECSQSVLRRVERGAVENKSSPASYRCMHQDVFCAEVRLPTRSQIPLDAH